MRALTVALFFLSLTSIAQTSCTDGETEITIVIISDNYPSEISWDLNVGGNEIAFGGSVGDTLCVLMDDEFPCFNFQIHDSYGDGIYSPGGYWVYLDGVEVGSGGNYSYGDQVLFDCAPGTTCNDPIALDQPSEEGVLVVQPGDDYWYTFTPEASGMFDLSSCGTGCDTRLYVYDYCNMGNFNDSNEGTIYYDDDQGGCGDEASQTMLLEADVTYWIRWASFEGNCNVDWEWIFSYGGPPTGCTDPEACNYNPDAELDNGSCIYPGDPACTGPDLIVVEEAIVNSIYATTMQVDESDCYISEGCLNGYGDREIVRFTTHIKNIGDLDYYIGQVSSDNNQFEFADCHSHWHHKGYAKYDLYNLDGSYIPIGFKNGFCVMDLECSGGGTGQYGCSNMGISAGCGDIYSSGLSCQWIDVTTIEDGTYFLIVRANWDFIPDALGREELDYTNNFASVCVNLDRSSGTLAVDVWNDCEPFYDCEGTLFGNAYYDCNGDCNGTALVGDLDYNGAQEYTDAVAYVEGVLGNDIDALPCTDIDQDGNVTVTDAALMSRCQYWNEAHTHPDSSGFHNKCSFPVNELINIYDTTHFKIGDINLNQGYLDVHVLNPNNRIVGYQLEFSGIEISQAISIADVVSYPITPSFAPGGSEVIGLSYEGESMMKFYEWTPFLRLYWINANDNIYLLNCKDVVNEFFQNTLVEIIDVYEWGCTTPVACNYDPEATIDDGTCEYPEELYDCDGNCLNDADMDYVCDEDEILGCTDLEAFNYNPEATDSDNTLCIYFVPDCNSFGDPGWLDTESGTYPEQSSGVFGEMYNEDIALHLSNTIVEAGSGVSYSLESFDFTSMSGLPDGLFSSITGGQMTPNSEVCVNISGIPIETGVFDILFTGEAIINVFGNLVDAGVISFTHTLEIGDNPNPISGCTYPGSDNYLLYAMVDDGSCIISGCTDPEASNFHLIFNLENGSCQYVEDILDCIEDLNQDGTIGTQDLLQLLTAYGQTCE